MTPIVKPNGRATYVFTAATLAAAGQQVPTPTGNITFVSVLIDVQGTADLTKIEFNGVKQRPAHGKHRGHLRGDHNHDGHADNGKGRR